MMAALANGANRLTTDDRRIGSATAPTRRRASVGDTGRIHLYTAGTATALTGDFTAKVSVVDVGELDRRRTLHELEGEDVGERLGQPRVLDESGNRQQSAEDRGDVLRAAGRPLL